jgi:hypothetical protein
MKEQIFIHRGTKEEHHREQNIYLGTKICVEVIFKIREQIIVKINKLLFHLVTTKNTSHGNIK